MCVPISIVVWLREQGRDVTHLREEGLQRLPNGDIFEKAIGENRVVLTFDLDFGEIAALSKGRRCSIILFRLRNTRSAHVIERLRSVLATSESELEEGTVIIVEESRIRIRRLPVGRE